MATTYLTRTNSGAGSETTSTFSVWFKRLSTTGTQYLLHTSEDANNKLTISFNGSFNVIGTNNSSTVMNLTPTRVFRDVSAWYHLVVAFDTTQATEADRVKLYINGVQETSFSTATYPSQNLNLKLNQSGDRRTVGNAYDNGGSPSNGYFSGLMSHIHWVDGTAYPASTFGETDATTGEWKIKTSPSVTYGTNGFFILKDGNSVTDQSGNSNNFTVGGGTLTKTEDCPSNVFATMNALQYSPNTTFSNGNNVVTQSVGGNGARRFTSTLGASSGKYYWETKITGTVNGMTFGIVDGVEGDYNNYVGYKSKEVGYEKDGVIYKNAAAVTTGLTVVALNDVVNHALDLDNGYIYFGVNGTWQNSGVPTSGATGTGGFSITADTLYHPAVSAFANTGQISCNFGNGYFGTTAVASAGTNASGNGIFEYDVPTGYTALSTKGLNL